MSSTSFQCPTLDNRGTQTCNVVLNQTSTSRIEHETGFYRSTYRMAVTRI